MPFAPQQSSLASIFPRPRFCGGDGSGRQLRPLRTRRVLVPLLLLGLLASATLRPAAAGESFAMPLLDESLSRWVISGCEAQAEDGVLKLVAGDGLVRSAHRYRDFVWELEYRPLQTSAWNAGIYFRCEPPAEGAVWPDKYQIDLKQGDEGHLLGVADTHTRGLIKEGTWNHFRLEVVGPKATLRINGQEAWTTDQIAAESGYIGIQAEVPQGGQFELRNMQLTELGYTSLFNGTDLTGWEGADEPAEACWRVTDGLLTCTGEKGPWLRSKEQYGDFNLRLEYRLREGGNSGVYVRVPADGNHHGPGAGVEVQLLDDAAEQYRMLKPYQYTGSVYAIVPAEPRVARPAGQWNVIEIDCHGASYRIEHNGVRIIDANAQQVPELAERLVEGYLGLQNHSEEVWFRHLRVGASAQR